MQNSFPNEDPISSKFEDLRSRDEGALITYLTGGDPNPEDFIDNASALIEGGADILEIGVPFSDPIADGPVIQAASRRALQAGTNLRKVLSMAKELSTHDTPIVILTYYNPILAMGAERFLQVARKSGVSGVVIPDLPVGEDPAFHQLALKYSVDRILLAAPNTPPSRLDKILSETEGFLYLVSLYGVTGPRKELGAGGLEYLKRVRSRNSRKIPVSAGFGVSTPDHVRRLMNAGADGAIVGSTLVKIIEDQSDYVNEASKKLKLKVVELKRATTKKYFRAA